MRALLCLLSAAALGCAAPYPFKAASGHIGLLWNSRSIQKSVDDPKTPPDVKAKLALVLEARRFAFDVLKLKPSGEMESWTPVKGRHVTYLVLAAPKLSLEPYEWHFPFIGRFPYKGYFKESDAEAEAARMEKRGYDSAISGAFAYNASLWIAGPLPSSALLLSPGRLAELVIHELVHGTISFKDRTQFNETLAEFVSDNGGQQFLSARFGSDSKELKDYRKALVEEKDRSELMATIAARLDIIYKSTATAEAKLAAREPELTRGLEQLRKAGLDLDKLNNAILSGHQVYHDDSDRLALKRALESVGRDWGAFIAILKKLDPKRPSEDLQKKFP